MGSSPNPGLARLPAWVRSGPTVPKARGRYRMSGNPASRPVKSRVPLSVECDEMILDTANHRVSAVSPAGSRPVRTLFEVQVLALGTSTGNARTATRRSIEATIDAARRLERRRDEALYAEIAEAVKNSRR